MRGDKHLSRVNKTTFISPGRESSVSKTTVVSSSSSSVSGISSSTLTSSSSSNSNQLQPVVIPVQPGGEYHTPVLDMSQKEKHKN